MKREGLEVGLVVRLKGQQPDLTIVNITTYVFEMAYFDNRGKYRIITLPLSAAPAVYLKPEPDR